MYRVDFTYSADDEIEFGEPYEVESPVRSPLPSWRIYAPGEGVTPDS